MSSRKASPVVEIVTPYSAQANNGNWRTAARWARLLDGRCKIILQSDWQPGRHDPRADCLIALHARRSHAAIREWRELFPHKPLAVVLTGTDLYRDLPGDADARDSLQLADRLVALQEDAINFLPRTSRAKARVVHQSARPLKPAAKAHARLRCILVGHLRWEKDPLTALRAWEHLPADEPISLLHAGSALEQGFADAAAAYMRREPRYRWVGEKPHAWVRQAIKRAHLLLLPSKMEGGANVIVEALTAGTPVLGSRMSGNLGMLGSGYPGYFPVGDSRALAELLLRCLHERGFYSRLAALCRARARLFAPEKERAALLRLIGEMLGGTITDS